MDVLDYLTQRIAFLELKEDRLSRREGVWLLLERTRAALDELRRLREALTKETDAQRKA